jgi:ABC-type lipoprotein export system ATPase subunit
MEFSPRELAIYRQIGIGIIFQNFNLIPSIKNIDNVTLPMAFLGIIAEKRKKRAMEIFDRLGIANLASRYPFELSGGQQQRVGIARALANDPPIILADEPIGNLDSANAKNVLDLLKELHINDGKTIIMVTHEAWSLRDVNRVFYMRDGMITKIEDRAKKPEVVKKSKSSYYYKALFPKLPTTEARSKILANLLLRGYAQPEIKRLEYFITQRFRNRIDSEIFEAVLDRPYKKGGVGLWKQRAKKIAGYVDEIIKEESALEKLYQKLEQNPEAPLYEEIAQIRNWLLKGFTVKLNPPQIETLNEAINERVKGVITADNFRSVLDLSKYKNGVGLKVRSAFKISEKLETILGKNVTINTLK